VELNVTPSDFADRAPDAAPDVACADVPTELAIDAFRAAEEQNQYVSVALMPKLSMQLTSSLSINDILLRHSMMAGSFRAVNLRLPFLHELLCEL
jgi:hypothetical protein